MTKICPRCKKEMVDHIIKEGARYHTPSWDHSGEHCSEPNCEINHGPGKCTPRDQKELNKFCGRTECKVTNPLTCMGCSGDEANDLNRAG
jgi:hypothetical protein